MDKIAEALLLASDMRPFYARAISALTPVASEMVPTIGVDTSWRLYYSPSWTKSVSLKQLAGVIAGHEIEHLLRDHANRRCERSHRQWNLAGDLEINDDCELELPPAGSYPSSYGLPNSLLAEEYFDRLSTTTGQCCGSGAGSPLPGELEPSGLAVDVAANDALVAGVRADVLAHVASAPGSVPGAIVMWASERPSPARLPWPRLLANAIRGEIGGMGRSDYSWGRMSRRQSAVMRPALCAIRPRIALIVDTSGSMGEHGAKVLGVVREIIGRSNSTLVVTVECDAVAKTKRSARDWRGGGGTDLREGFALISAVKRDATVVVTDCESPWPAAVPNTIVLSTTTHSAPPWASTIRI